MGLLLINDSKGRTEGRGNYGNIETGKEPHSGVWEKYLTSGKSRILA